MIGIALMCDPLIIADEPTTALDVTTQKEILKIFNDLKKYKDITMALISHDIAVISEVSESILVMNEGKIVEKVIAKSLKSLNHEYTKHLLSCIQNDEINVRKISRGKEFKSCSFEIERNFLDKIKNHKFLKILIFT